MKTAKNLLVLAVTIAFVASVQARKKCFEIEPTTEETTPFPCIAECQNAESFYEKLSNDQRQYEDDFIPAFPAFTQYNGESSYLVQAEIYLSNPITQDRENALKFLQQNKIDANEKEKYQREIDAFKARLDEQSALFEYLKAFKSSDCGGCIDDVTKFEDFVEISKVYLFVRQTIVDEANKEEVVETTPFPCVAECQNAENLYEKLSNDQRQYEDDFIPAFPAFTQYNGESSYHVQAEIYLSQPNTQDGRNALKFLQQNKIDANEMENYQREIDAFKARLDEQSTLFEFLKSFKSSDCGGCIDDVTKFGDFVEISKVYLYIRQTIVDEANNEEVVETTPGPSTTKGPCSNCPEQYERRLLDRIDDIKSVIDAIDLALTAPPFINYYDEAIKLIQSGYSDQNAKNILKSNEIMKYQLEEYQNQFSSFQEVLGEPKSSFNQQEASSCWYCWFYAYIGKSHKSYEEHLETMNVVLRHATIIEETTTTTEDIAYD